MHFTNKQRTSKLIVTLFKNMYSAGPLESSTYPLDFNWQTFLARRWVKIGLHISLACRTFMTSMHHLEEEY